ncbi:MAG: Trm112 family protein [Nitrospinaceae bacterium]|nr:Trm112 family protein [Nitrospinaceae bacterium]NIR57209.1 Trm112 family protein [Nitrospinaceae bacterium]NIS87652.1 Trm112 family protein [Nitrospinaceae bacterium]NIT84518.1 Trm112 family protein [Nitrospinaceae bacterium]NIU46709.1 Trm112 family protein [Nitrospinaceae bacterium]
MAMDPDLIRILICPQCEGELHSAPERDGVICETCRLKFPVKEDTPVLLVPEAEPCDPKTKTDD